MSVCKNEKAMYGFMNSPLHREGMQRGLPALKTARFARVRVHKSEIPMSWQRAENLIADKGYDYGDQYSKNLGTPIQK